MRRSIRHTGGRRTPTILIAALLVIAPFTLVPKAEAAGPTWGDLTCPRGFNDYTAASQACYYGTTMYQTHALLGGAPLIYTESPTGNEYIKFKLTLFSGSPCTSYLEGGLIGWGRYANVNYSPYYEWRKTDGTWQRNYALIGPWNNGHRLDVFWYQGGTSFGMSWDGFRPATPNFSASGFGWGGCITEAGIFGATSFANQFWRLEATPMNISELTSWDAGTGVVHAGWNRQVTDRPCGPVAVPECFDGIYYGSQVWASGKRY